MSAVIRRLPLLAGRGLAAASCMPAMSPVAARVHRGLTSLAPLSAPSFWRQQQQRKLPLYWKQGTRWFSSASEAEGLDATYSTRTAEQGPPAEEFRGGSPNRVFVHNISWRVDDQTLASHFSQVGTVRSARIVRKRDNSGASMGFGFVEFETAEAATTAINQLNDSDLDGRGVRVREDRGDRVRSDRGGYERRERAPMRERYGERSYGERSYGERSYGERSYGERPYGERAPRTYGDRPPRGDGPRRAPDTRVVVHGLPWSFQWHDLKDLAKRALEGGTADPESVLRADIRTRPDNTSRGWGILHMATVEDAKAAIEMLDGSTLDGRVLSAKLDEFAMGRPPGQDYEGGHSEPEEEAGDV